MRTQLIGLFFLGLTSLIQAQTSIETDVDAQSVDLKDVIISANSRYMNKVYDQNSSLVVKNFEQIIAGYDITSSDVYSSDYDTYQVNFITDNKTRMTATYDSDGNILSSNERYHDILLPHSLRQSIAKNYEGWDLHRNTYRVSYNQNGDIKKVYKIQVLKDGKKKNLKINVEGNMAIVSLN